MQFLVSNIDAIITSVLGTYFTIYALRRRETLSKSSNGLTRLLPVLAPLLLIFGLVQFFIHGTPSEPPAAWTTIQTDDGIAQASFPESPERTEATDRAGEIEVHRITHAADLSGGKLNLRLSFNEYPPQSKALTDDERVAGMREFFRQGGFSIVEDAELSNHNRKLVVAKDDSKSRVSIHFRMMRNGIYRAIATSLNGSHDDPRIERFLQSFQINEN